MAATDYAGLIGAEFLERFTVVFDHPNKRIFLTPNRHYPDLTAYDESGVRVQVDPPEFHRFIVTRIVPESPAAKAGIVPGDVITSIASHPAEDLTLTELRHLLRRPDAQYALGIRRGDRQLQVVIRLRRLI